MQMQSAINKRKGILKQWQLKLTLMQKIIPENKPF